MRRIRTYHEVDPEAGAELLDQVVEQRRRVARRLAPVGAVVAVMSGKGGVGKSAVTANLAAALAARGLRVGALDGDLNGPSLGRMLGVVGRRLVDGPDGVEPATGAAGVRVVSMELLQQDHDAPLRWRGPDGHASLWRGAAEASALRELLSDVAWGPLDVLLVDMPPGTDRMERLLELTPPALCLLVTTPSRMSCRVVARSARLLREAGAPATALVANMTTHACEACGHATPLFGADAVADLARDTDLDVWAEVPFEAGLAESTDEGRPWLEAAPDSPAAEAFRALAARVEARVPRQGPEPAPETPAPGEASP